MREEFKVFIERIETDLSNLQSEPNPVKRYIRCMDRVKDAILEVPKKDFFEVYDGETGMHIIRELMPELFRKLLHYHLLFDLEMQRTTSTKDEYKRYCQNKLGGIRTWHDVNIEFIEYYYSERFEEEEWLFLGKDRGNVPEVLKEQLRWPFQKISIAMVATILAYGDFAKILKNELQGPDKAVEPAEWKGSTTELVEQILGEYLAKHTEINGKPATLDYFIARAEKMYSNVSLKNFEQLASQMRRRNETTAYHAEKIKRLLAQRDKLLQRK